MSRFLLIQRLHSRPRDFIYYRNHSQLRAKAGSLGAIFAHGLGPFLGFRGVGRCPTPRMDANLSIAKFRICPRQAIQYVCRFFICILYLSFSSSFLFSSFSFFFFLFLLFSLNPSFSLKPSLNFRVDNLKKIYFTQSTFRLIYVVKRYSVPQYCVVQFVFY